MFVTLCAVAGSALPAAAAVPSSLAGTGAGADANTGAGADANTAPVAGVASGAIGSAGSTAADLPLPHACVTSSSLRCDRESESHRPRVRGPLQPFSLIPDLTLGVSHRRDGGGSAGSAASTATTAWLMLSWVY